MYQAFQSRSGRPDLGFTAPITGGEEDTDFVHIDLPQFQFSLFKNLDPLLLPQEAWQTAIFNKIQNRSMPNVMRRGYQKSLFLKALGQTLWALHQHLVQERSAVLSGHSNA